MDEDLYDVMTEEFDLTPEEVDRLMELGMFSGELERTIPRQQRYAEQLRGTGMPRGRAYGGVYRHAHPMEFIGSTALQALGHYGEKQARDRQLEILREQANRRSQYMQKFLNRMGERAGQGTPSATPSPSMVPPTNNPAPYGAPGAISPMAFGHIDPRWVR